MQLGKLYLWQKNEFEVIHILIMDINFMLVENKIITHA